MIQKYKREKQICESVTIFVDGKPIGYLVGKNQYFKFINNILYFQMGTSQEGFLVLNATKIELKSHDNTILSSDVINVDFDLLDAYTFNFRIKLTKG